MTARGHRSRRGPGAPALVLAALLAGASAHAQERSPLPIFQIEAVGLSEDEDKAFRRGLEHRLATWLRTSSKWSPVTVSDAERVEVGSRRKFFEWMDAAYGLKGRIESTLGGLRVQVELMVRDASASSPEPPPIAWVMPKNIETAIRWYDRVGERVYAIVHGEPTKPDVFAWCFVSRAGDEDDLHEFRVYLPFELRDALLTRGFADEYSLRSFDDPATLARECDKPGYPPSSLAMYSYLMQGEVELEPRGNARFLRAAVKVHVRAHADRSGRATLKTVERAVSQSDRERLAVLLAEALQAMWHDELRKNEVRY